MESTADETLEQMMVGLRSTLDATNLAREQALRLSREVIQHSARTIRAVHRGEMESALTRAREARQRVQNTTDALRAVLERTRGDLTLTLSQKRLEQALALADATVKS